ncbi:hypothetical protein NMG60_11012951 [Bertholletia excelsa]
MYRRLNLWIRAVASFSFICALKNDLPYRAIWRSHPEQRWSGAQMFLVKPHRAALGQVAMAFSPSSPANSSCRQGPQTTPIIATRILLCSYSIRQRVIYYLKDS